MSLVFIHLGQIIRAHRLSLLLNLDGAHSKILRRSRRWCELDMSIVFPPITTLSRVLLGSSDSYLPHIVHRSYELWVSIYLPPPLA